MRAKSSAATRAATGGDSETQAVHTAPAIRPALRRVRAHSILSTSAAALVASLFAMPALAQSEAAAAPQPAAATPAASDTDAGDIVVTG